MPECTTHENAYSSLRKNRTLVFPRLLCKYVFQKDHASCHCWRFQCSIMNAQRVIQEKQGVQFFAGNCRRSNKMFFRFLISPGEETQETNWDVRESCSRFSLFYESRLCLLNHAQGAAAILVCVIPWFHEKQTIQNPPLQGHVPYLGAICPSTNVFFFLH